ncbi:MAG: haloacid dehalogenase-like hydrolase [Clostridium argentinense]|uniref:phosphoserine phosphatase n=1 Tax=Clostridium faecium TaxID=2762223 RepID=A0ABR8YSW7_9CLOT|nr:MULTISPECIES: haloacid dehalogenase-like hydrolase [Clostridium]MBD8047343.1 haloacid dehalogenase-like hydrolase [Clostridium faecium]MBS5823915.1 haloacid dehalogenase-like hydrolase [Clostridium argentinense]MDU1350277.1 haloacid dehalogenase-like hydrolase [Clostridium argentinense]
MNNFKRKTLSLSLACIMSVSLVACGNSTKTEETKNDTKVEQSDSKQEIKLEEGNWAPENYTALTALIEKYGKNSKDYDENKKPYAVFDWDNTSIINDVEEALLAYQLENLEFKMTPEEFSNTIRINIPKDNFKESCNNAEGKPVNIELVGADIDSDYKFLYENYKGFKGTKSLEEIKATAEYKDFVAKTRYLYNSIGESFSSDVSYPWVTYLFAGMTETEVAELTEKSNDYWLNHELGEETWTSPKELPGKAGVVSVKFHTGLRTIKEQQNLYKTLMANGIDVYICSASFIDVVRTFATNPKFGYELPKENIFAMELERDDKGIIKAEFRKGYDQTQSGGKTKTIEKFLVEKHGGQGPLIVGGDSAGDVAMLSDFKDTKFSLIINRCKGDELGKLSKEASETIGKSDARYYLQGRDENTGEFRPSQKSVFLGSKEEKLLK